ncbi:MAG: macro domain-containing protein [Chlamydiales bacterium]|nr:macro domain-containing protein [Chlamydiales bacterium]
MPPPTRGVTVKDIGLENLHKGTLSVSTDDAQNLPRAQGPLERLLKVNPIDKDSYFVSSYKGSAIAIKPLGEIGYDLYTEDVEAIVNAANTGMLGGGGVDGAFNAFNAGTGFAAERSKCKVCFGSEISTGGAFMTGAYNFSTPDLDVAPSRSSVSGKIITPGGKTPGTVKKVIHAIGPSGTASVVSDAKLSLAYKNACLLAHRAGLTSIAFPVLSVGLFNYPVKNAASAILRGIQVFIDENPDTSLKDIRIIGSCYNMKEAAERLINPPGLSTLS